MNNKTLRDQVDVLRAALAEKTTRRTFLLSALGNMARGAVFCGVAEIMFVAGLYWMDVHSGLEVTWVSAAALVSAMWPGLVEAVGMGFAVGLLRGIQRVLAAPRSAA